MGPHHPSMHGVLRLIVTLDGEDVVDYEPILGYLHRGMEKITENRTIIQYLPYVMRWDYLATMFTEAITVNEPEQLGNIQVPKRASYIRVIMLELSRIASHLLWLGPFMADIGAQTPFFNIFRERELVYDLFEAATDMRMMHNYFHIGGVAADLPYGWLDKCLDFCFVVSANGLEVDQEKIKAIQDWPTPMTVTQVRRFHGLANFAKTFEIQCDASGVGISAILTQEGRPVAYFSKKLSGAVLNYPVYDKEMYALIRALETWYEGFLLKEGKLCIPCGFVRDLLVHEAHSGGLMGHFRVNKMLATLHEHLYWPRMRKDMERVCERCIACEYNVSATFNVVDLSFYDIGGDLGANCLEERGNDTDTPPELSAANVDPLELPVGPIT
ncbi:NAD(P)H-quinone oxidoreductase subunit H-like [Gossypium hirsutum]|uniref:NAD(P)H-quinone oxidoreductase subunit H-like n=1 Tax=Gossypium hirsutum TaxID=3635 RepID=A0ABM3BJ94_GOSHI|nr:NAD(P)H-quinone oxidoreductase subunit H-like [Gossypium hirsutum]